MKAGAGHKGRDGRRRGRGRGSTAGRVREVCVFGVGEDKIMERKDKERTKRKERETAVVREIESQTDKAGEINSHACTDDQHVLHRRHCVWMLQSCVA